MQHARTFYAHSPSLNQLVSNTEFKTSAITLPDWLQDLNDGAYRGVEDWAAQASHEENAGIRIA